MLTKKLACPSCRVHLRVADTLTAGKRIKCPKCGAAFSMPGGDELPPAPKAVPARPRKAAPPPAEDDRDLEPEERPVRKAPAARPRKAAPPPRKAAPPPAEDDDRDEEVEERPLPRKRRKKPQPAASKTPLVIGGAVLLLAVVAGALAVVFKPAANKAEPVAANLSARPGPAGPGPGAAPPAEPEPGAVPGSAALTQTSAAAPQVGSGRQLFDRSCARCHTIGGATAGGGRRGGSRGPDLTTVGADPTHTVDWLVTHIRNPQAHRPDSRMPAFEGRMQPQDMRAVAEYLASLK
jgi:mono/diheme cytochrome c family protein